MEIQKKKVIILIDTISLVKGVKGMDDNGAGRRIRDLRKVNGYTREMLSEKARISSKFLYEIEQGRKGFSAKVLLRIADAMSVSCDYILRGSNKQQNYEQIIEILESIRPEQIQKVKEILLLIQDLSNETEKNEDKRGRKYD